jgi:hypothetical protein
MGQCCKCFNSRHLSSLRTPFQHSNLPDYDLRGIWKADIIPSNLYYGVNGISQKVFTWVAAQNTTRFVGDIGPLLDNLGSIQGPQTNEYLGYVAFGSETLYAPRNMTFSVNELSLMVNSK